MAIATVLPRNTLLGDKDRGVIATRLKPFITDKQLLNALSGWILNLDIGVETETSAVCFTIVAMRAYPPAGR